MSGPTQDHVRNIGIAAHIDAGKTTLTERILYFAGELYKIGEVHEGTAHTDYLAEERRHGITITSAVTRAHWQDHLIQIVDTPGHVDFTIEVERSMRVLDSCVIVLDAVRGVEPQTETVWRQRTKFDLPGLFFINKVDRAGASYPQALESIRRRLGVKPVPVTLPLPGRPELVHLIDRTLLRFSGERGEIVETFPCDPETWASVATHRETLLLELADRDDTLAERVLNNAEPTPEHLWRTLRQATLDRALFPCFAGAALRNLGVQPLLDAIVHLLPCPLDRPPSAAFRPDGTAERVLADPLEPLVALAFKVQRWDGRRHVFARIYRGTLKAGDAVAFHNHDHRPTRETVVRIFDVDAANRTRMDVARAGQIVLLAGLRHASTGDTLCAPDHLLSLERIEAREPVLSLAVEPMAGDQKDRFIEALERLQEEDPTLRLGENPETGQRLLSGMGELHLQILIERLEREYSLQVRTGRPAVACRETITCAATASSLFHPPRDPNHQAPEVKARVQVAVSPAPRGGGRRIFVEPEVLPGGASLSQAQRAALEQAAQASMTSGPLEGAPLEDLDVHISQVELFGSASTLDALCAATSRATHQAIAQARPALLQPIMAAEVLVPEDNLGATLGDLQSRHAVIVDTSKSAGQAVIQCEVSLAKLLGYTTDLRSLTQGRGHFQTQFLRFDTPP